VSPNLSSVAFFASNLACPALFEMFHKRQKDFAFSEPASKRFRRNAADLFRPVQTCSGLFRPVPLARLLILARATSKEKEIPERALT